MFNILGYHCEEIPAGYARKPRSESISMIRNPLAARLDPASPSATRSARPRRSA